EPLTGERYVKKQFGPCAYHLDTALNELSQAGLMHITGGEEDYESFQFHAKGNPDLSYFTDKELSLIRSQIKFVTEDHTAGSISDRSHDQIWKIASMGEEIPYQAYLVKKFLPPTPEDFAWAKAEIAKL